jgi:hypothetical protein
MFQNTLKLYNYYGIAISTFKNADLTICNCKKYIFNFTAEIKVRWNLENIYAGIWAWMGVFWGFEGWM